MNRTIRFIVLGSVLLSPFCYPVADAQTIRTSTGVVMADRNVTLAAKIVGRIVAVNVEEGQSVAAGDVLIDIDDAQLRADLSSARAALEIEGLAGVETAGARRLELGLFVAAAGDVELPHPALMAPQIEAGE